MHTNRYPAPVEATCRRRRSPGSWMFRLHWLVFLDTNWRFQNGSIDLSSSWRQGDYITIILFIIFGNDRYTVLVKFARNNNSNNNHATTQKYFCDKKNFNRDSHHRTKLEWYTILYVFKRICVFQSSGRGSVFARPSTEWRHSYRPGSGREWPELGPAVGERGVESQ